MKSINQFVSEVKNAFGDVQYKAVSNDGQVFKSKNWVDDIKTYTEIVPAIPLKVENAKKR